MHPGQTLTAGRDRRVYKALDKDHVLIETAGFDKDHRQTPGYNAAKAKTFSDARVTFTEEQVRKECARCLGCGATKVDSYLCIGCGLCTTKCKFDAIHLKKVRDWHAGSYETMPIKVAEGVVKRAGSIVKKGGQQVMHELALCDAMLKMVRDISREQALEGVRSITVRVGTLSGVVPRFSPTAGPL